jgi:hypothetical protein
MRQASILSTSCGSTRMSIFAVFRFIPVKWGAVGLPCLIIPAKRLIGGPASLFQRLVQRVTVSPFLVSGCHAARSRPGHPLPGSGIRGRCLPRSSPPACDLMQPGRVAALASAALRTELEQPRHNIAKRSTELSEVVQVVPYPLSGAGPEPPGPPRNGVVECFASSAHRAGSAFFLDPHALPGTIDPPQYTTETKAFEATRHAHLVGFRGRRGTDVQHERRAEPQRRSEPQRAASSSERAWFYRAAIRAIRRPSFRGRPPRRSRPESRRRSPPSRR